MAVEEGLLSEGRGFPITCRQREQSFNRRRAPTIWGHDGVRLPVQAVDYIPDGVDQVLVLLRVGQNDVVKPLHVAVDGLQGGRLSAA